MLTLPCLGKDEVIGALAAQPYVIRFPNLPGVYVLERPGDDTAWYVGETADLRQRLANHEVRRALHKTGPVRCRILVCGNRKEVECWLIDAFAPILNKVRETIVFTTPEATMQWRKETLQLLSNVDAYQLAPGIRRDIAAIAHKIRHPMADILPKVPGDTLAARARAVGVSRQTMYVWAAERFRPSTDQARIIADLTGVPIDEIRDYQEGKDDGSNGAGKAARKARPRVAKASRSLPAGAARLRAKRGGVALKPGKRGHVGTLRKRTRKRPVSGESV
jgi:DNA-binding XRE family transcriptional regulator